MSDTDETDVTATTEGELRIMQFNATPEGFGMIIDYVGRQNPFASFEAKVLIDALYQQLKHGHHLVAMRRNRIVGYAGWLLTSSEIAEGWIENRTSLIRKSDAEATAAALTIVASQDRAAITKLMRGARRLNPGKRAYFKRAASATKPARKRSARI
jgi:hypothetical protein